MATVTLEEVWALFKETDRILKENARAAEQRFQEIVLQMKENAKETERLMKESSAKFDKQLADSEKSLRTQIGDVTKRLGEFVEGMIEPAAVRLFQERGLDVHRVISNLKVKDKNFGGIEIDLFVSNNDSCVLIEVKSNLSIDDVNEHLKRMEKFKSLFPEYAHKKTYGAVAGMVIADNVAKYAYKKGFFVIGQQGDSAVILNDSISVLILKGFDVDNSNILICNRNQLFIICPKLSALSMKGSG